MTDYEIAKMILCNNIGQQKFTLFHKKKLYRSFNVIAPELKMWMNLTNNFLWGILLHFIIFIILRELVVQLRYNINIIVPVSH